MQLQQLVVDTRAYCYFLCAASNITVVCIFITVNHCCNISEYQHYGLQVIVIMLLFVEKVKKRLTVIFNQLRLIHVFTVSIEQ